MLPNAYYTRRKDDTAVLATGCKMYTSLAAEYRKTIGNILPLNMRV